MSGGVNPGNVSKFSKPLHLHLPHLHKLKLHAQLKMADFCIYQHAMIFMLWAEISGSSTKMFQALTGWDIIVQVSIRKGVHNFKMY
jgi:hypothetical protein